MFACVCACTGACPLMNVRRREHQSDMPVHCPMHLATLIRAGKQEHSTSVSHHT